MNKKLKLLLAMLTVTTALGVASACSDSSNTSSTPPESSSSSPVKKESYTVRFVNEDNSIISEKKYEEGTIPEKPADPTYSAEHYTYVFTGWDKEIKAVEDDVIYKAVYTKTAKEYTVTFKADGEAVGEPLKYTMDAPTVTPPQIPSKTDFDASWEAYELNGGNKEVNAVYTPTEYTVTFVNPRTGMPVLAPMKYTVQGKDDFVFPAIPDEIKQPGYTVSWDKTNADLHMCVVSNRPILTLLNRISRIRVDSVIRKLDRKITGIINYRRYVPKNLVESLFKEPLIRVLLNLNKIWHFGSRFDLREAHSHVCAKLLGLKSHK